MKLFYVTAEDERSPLLVFLNGLEPKLRQKLAQQFKLLALLPLPREPTVKHFTIAKYSGLYELRSKSKIMIRLIFTILEDGNILFLTPFVKKHKRNTMQALETSLKLLAQIDNGTCSVKEMSINQITEESE